MRYSRPPAPARPMIPAVVSQHVEESALLAWQRMNLAVAPHVKLHHLRRLDERLAAHLDGVAVAGEPGSALCLSALANAGPGELFVATVRALEDRNQAGLEKLLSLAERMSGWQPAQEFAVGWVSALYLEGTIASMLASDNPARRRVALGACVTHRVDPGRALFSALADGNQALRERALAVAGASGRRDCLASCLEALAEADTASARAAARAAVLLGERSRAFDRLSELALAAGLAGRSELRLALEGADARRAGALLEQLAQRHGPGRLLVQGVGAGGDPAYIPWLIRQTDELGLSRVAGEAFSLMSGVDLALCDLETKPPEQFAPGPTDNPDDDDVAMDEDDGLPWPDPAKLQAWWAVNQQNFQLGVRYFMGAPPSVEHCRKVLREGYQRQRVAAAEYLCLLQPGTPLFPTSAPAWRQQRWLRQMG